MLKKVISVLLAVLMVFSSVSLVASAKSNSSQTVEANGTKNDLNIVVYSEAKVNKNDEVPITVQVTNNANRDCSNVSVNLSCNWFFLESDQGSEIAVGDLQKGETKTVQFVVKRVPVSILSFFSLQVIKLIDWLFRQLLGANSETTRHFIKIGLIKFMFVLYAHEGSDEIVDKESYTVFFDLLRY